MKNSNRITHKEALKRAKELVSKMTLDEKASQLTYNAAPVNHLNIPRYNWWNEGLHGVARAGTATVFPQAIGLAATFDDELLGKIAGIIATEGRAKYNEYAKGLMELFDNVVAGQPATRIIDLNIKLGVIKWLSLKQYIFVRNVVVNHRSGWENALNVTTGIQWLKRL